MKVETWTVELIVHLESRRLLVNIGRGDLFLKPLERKERTAGKRV